MRPFLGSISASQHFSLSAPLQTALIAGGFLGCVRCLFIAGEEISQTTKDFIQLLFLDSAEATDDQRMVRGEELANLYDAFFGQLLLGHVPSYERHLPSRELPGYLRGDGAEDQIFLAK